MKGIKLTEAIRLLFLVILLVLFLTSAYSGEVPKSETIIIPGELNDSKEHAQSFDNETEYVFAIPSAPQQVAQKSMSAQNLYESTSNTDSIAKLDSWRKTTFQDAGTLVITLSYDIDSNYSIEVYNSCSNKNYCEEYEFGTYKTCVMNIQPGNYYFKVVNISGSGKYYLDVDIIKNQQKSEINAWECVQVACSQNKDCGTNGFEGEKYCKSNESHQNYITYTCNNPGRDSAICTNTQEEVLIENCNSCYNGDCILGPTLTCPIEAVSENYLFKWNALDYTSLTSIEFSSSADFKSKKSVNVKNLKTLLAKNYYSTLISYENTSKEKKVYARLVGKNASKEIKYSRICAFNLTPKTNSVINCPTEPIDENYIFTIEKKDTVSPKVQISYTPQFKNNFQITVNQNNQALVKNYYRTLGGVEILLDF